MADRERKIINEILSNLPGNERLFRINAGQGWAGSAAVKREKNGSLTVTIKNARPFHAAPPGWPDLFGWETVNGIAVAKAVEIKTGKQKLSENQKLFRKCLLNMGGIFETVHEENINEKPPHVKQNQ